MKITSKITSACLVAIPAVALAQCPLIIDTDLGFDVDDVGAIAVGHYLHGIGAAKVR